MKKSSIRLFVAMGIAATLGFCTPVIASASARPHSNTTTTTSTTVLASTPKNPAPIKAYRQQLQAYRDARANIESTFRSAVSSARATYMQARSTAHSAAARSADQQALQADVLLAATQRSAALTALGSPPVKP